MCWTVDSRSGNLGAVRVAGQGDIDARLEECCRLWGLHAPSRMRGGFSGASVFACVDRLGNPVVVKLSESAVDAERQAAALQAWRGQGAVELIAFADDVAALLMPRLVPGTPLRAGDDAATIAVVAQTLRSLHAATRVSVLPTMAVAFDEYLTHARSHAEPDTSGVSLLDASRAAAMDLIETTSSVVLPHGDPLDKNLLLHGNEYVAVDPIPRLGDPCSDIGFFSAGRQPCSGLFDRASLLADMIGVDRHRAMRWAAVWVVGEACETWRSDSEDLQRLVRTAPVLRHLGG